MQNTESGRVLKYWELMRGAISSENYIAATVLINEIKKLNTSFENADSAYTALLKVADLIGVSNPFIDKERFYLIYKESVELKSLDWEGAIALERKYSRMSVLPLALINEYKTRLSNKYETVLIAEAEQFVPCLQGLVDDNPNTEFVMTTQNVIYAKAIENVFDGYENVSVIITSIYQYGFLNRRFDVIFSCPAFGGRTLNDDQNFMCREYDMVALENLALHLNSDGKLVIVLPGRITFASGRVSELRQFIQLSYKIKELAELPEGTLEYCGIKAYLLELVNSRPDEDDDVVIRRYSSGEKKTRRSAITSLDVADDTFVMLGELIEQGDWSIDRIFAQQDEEYLSYQNSSTRKEKIGNVAQVFRGKSVNKKDAAGNIGVVNISNIGQYEVDYDSLDHLDEEERKVSNYLLQEGDVLLPARGTAIRTAVFHHQSYPCIASSNVIVIRPDARLLDSTYLKIFLDSPIGNKLISGAQQGMTVMNISYKDLNILEIPLPVMEKQKTTAEEYRAELKKYTETISVAEKRWKETLSKLQKF